MTEINLEELRKLVSQENEEYENKINNLKGLLNQKEEHEKMYIAEIEDLKEHIKGYKLLIESYQEHRDPYYSEKFYSQLKSMMFAIEGIYNKEYDHFTVILELGKLYEIYNQERKR